jgi:hypothetical protein
LIALADALVQAIRDVSPDAKVDINWLFTRFPCGEFMAHSFSIRNWEKPLKEFGYLKDRQASGAFSRLAGVRKLFIRKSHPLSSEGNVHVDLDIGRPYPGEEGGWTIILPAQLQRTAAPIISGAGAEWGPEEGDAALAATIQYGLPWLEEYSKLEKLIEYFETTLRDGIPRKPLKFPAIFKTLYSDPEPTGPRRPPIHHWYLAELYLEQGNRESSRSHAEQYLATLPDTQFWQEERGKVLNLIQATKTQS